MKRDKRNLFIALVVVLYFFLVFDVNFHGPDEPVYFAYTQSIVEDGDLNLVNQVNDDYGRVVTKTYNLPDFHTHAGAVFWSPFYIIGKSVYLVIEKLNLNTVFFFSKDQATKCAVSFSTFLFSVLTILVSFVLCRRFCSLNASLWGILVIFFATPFSYYTLFETGNSQIIAALVIAIAIIVILKVDNLKGFEWFWYGVFLSFCVALRIETWLLVLILLFYITLLCVRNKIIWRNLFYVLLGLIPVILFRGVNSYLKFGLIRFEECFFIQSLLRFRATYIFDGFFSDFRGIFYSLPVLYLCFAGSAIIIKRLFDKKDISESKNILALVLSIYLVLKIIPFGGTFSPAGDSPSSRLFIADFSILSLLLAYLFECRLKWARIFFYLAGFLCILWNLSILAYYMTNLDWFFVGSLPNLIVRFFGLEEVFYALFMPKNIFIKVIVCIPMVIFISCVVYSSRKYLQGKDGLRHMRTFILATVIVLTSYAIITLLNVRNNWMNSEAMMKTGFTDFSAISSSPFSLTEYEEEEHLWTLYKARAYYALKGNFYMDERIKEANNKVLKGSARMRLHRIPYQAYRGLGINYKNSGRYERAISVYQKAILLDPQDFEAYISLGDIYSITGKYDNALEFYKQALAINPQIWKIYIRIGELYDRKGDIDKAILSYKKALEINSGFAEAYFVLGRLYSDSKNYIDAINYFERFLNFNQHSPEVYTKLAEVCINNGKGKDAIKYYLKSIDFYPNYIDAYLSLADLYRDEGAYDKAVQYYKEYIKRNLKSAEAYNSLADVYRKVTEYEKAVDCYRQVIRLNPKNAWAYFDLALTYNSKGDIDNAIRQAEILRSLNRDDLAIKLGKSLRRE